MAYLYANSLIYTGSVKKTMDRFNAGEHILSIYFHDPYDMNWDANSYKFITTISSVEDFVNIYKAFEDLWLRGMFFIMREHIMPRWEDEHNINGGCLSFKVIT